MVKKKSKYSSLEHSRKDTIQAMVMVAPSLLGFLILVYCPIIYILRYAPYDFNGYQSSFTGIENFIRLFTRDT
ncbi:MAG: hypothetical protein LBI94_09865, partial [Treponema sp.]|nr:hypothetical protein [Treponema sp.]